MKHFGDITKIHGCAVPITDCVIGGSPCQDLSVAGKREGLAGARSGLFMEQIRIVKEMRYADQCSGRAGQFIRPRYMVWENVPGAFSSNKGEDFRAVLEEICRVADETADVPGPKAGKWDTSGAILGKRWAVAWRVLDAQFWGVPQRRRRIALVADFGGYTAPEILFERNGVSGDIAEGKGKGEGITRGAEGGFREAECYPINTQIITRHKAMGRGTGFGLGDNGEPAYTLQAGHEHGVCSAICYDMTHATDVIRECGETAPTLQSRMGTGGNQVPLTFSMQGFGDYRPDDVASSCKMRDYKDSTDLIASVDCRNGDESEVNGTLQAKPSGGQSLNLNNVVRTGYAVRRLTPLECERLQGFPDGWTDIGEWEKPCKNGKVRKLQSADSLRYKALGNSIALPPWKWVLKRLCAFYERDATMASLFDGIGGFPLIWEQLNGKGSCLWASEIEEFPIAVTKRHFSELEATP